MKALKFIGLALVAVLMLMALGLAVIAWRFDPAWAKQKLTQAVYEQKQRVLKIDGDLALSFFPSIALRLGDASLSERNSAVEFARVGDARLSVRVVPLLARQLVVDRIELDGVRARIVRTKDGTFNFDDLLSKEKAGGKESAQTAQGTPITFDVAGVGITRSSVLIQDGKTGRAVQLGDVNVNTGRLSQSASGPFEIAFKAVSEQPKLAAAFKLSGTYRYDLVRKQYAVEELALTANGQAAQDAIEAKITVPRLALMDGRASGPSASASIRLSGQQRQLEAKLGLSALEGAAAQWRIGKVDAQWSLKQGALAAQGTIAGAVEGSLDWGKSQAMGKFSTRLDESAVQGSFKVAKLAPLAAAFDLAIDRLNIDRYLPQTTPAKAAGGPATPGQASEPSPIDFSFLRGLDLNGKVRIGFLQARNVKLSNVATTLVASNGRLDLNPLSANLYGGHVGGSLTAQADGNRVALKQTMDNVAIGPLLKDYAQKDILEGRGRLALDVNAAGTSAIAFRQSLNGSAAVSLRDGTVKGINLAKSLRQAKATIQGGKQDAAIAGNKAEKTDFSELTASFRITKGVARNDDLSAKSPFLRTSGAGHIDLARGQLDYLAKVTVVASSKGQEGKELADLNGLTIPVRLTGPINEPTYRLEIGALVAELAKQQVQKQIGEQLHKQLGKESLDRVFKGLIR